jgi:hypothetical protein
MFHVFLCDFGMFGLADISRELSVPLAGGEQRPFSHIHFELPEIHFEKPVQLNPEQKTN